MGKESMGEFLESAVGSVLRLEYTWPTVIENYHLLRPSSVKKKHEPKVSSIEIDVFATGCGLLPSQSAILAPKRLNEVLLVQCKDEWYEHEHKPATEFLHKAEEIALSQYPSANVRKVIVTLLLSPNALKGLRESQVQVICNVAHLKNRTMNMRKSEREKMGNLLNDHLQNGVVGDLRDEIVNPLLGQVYRYINKKHQSSLTNFPSLAMQCFRFFINLNHFADEKRSGFIADEFYNDERLGLSNKRVHPIADKAGSG
jgi:hypothetical protein